jgi:hypothetical protein
MTKRTRDYHAVPAHQDAVFHDVPFADGESMRRTSRNAEETAEPAQCGGNRAVDADDTTVRTAAQDFRADGTYQLFCDFTCQFPDLHRPTRDFFSGFDGISSCARHFRVDISEKYPGRWTLHHFGGEKVQPFAR